MNGTTQTITWEWDGGNTEIYVYYSPDDGMFWDFIGNATASTESLEISADFYIGETSKIRVTSANDPGIADESDDFFSVIFNPVYFSSPQFGDEYYPGQSTTIYWDSFTFFNYDLSFSADGGENWTLLLENSPINFYEWTVPEIFSTQCMIKVSDANDPTDFGLSPNFTILEQPTVTFTSPVGGDVWTFGEDIVMSWTGSNLPFVVYFDYSLDGGQTWKYFGNAYSGPTSGSADVNVPKDSSSNVKIRMLTSDYDFVIGESEIFTIYTPPVTVFYPYDGQEFYIGGPASLLWVVINVDLVNVEFSMDGGDNWEMIETNLDADQYSYNWTITGSPSDNCLIKISDANDPNRFGISGIFSIIEAPKITLTNPVGNELWKTESIYSISWSYENPEFYNLIAEYSIDSGNTWTNIAFGLPAQGSVDWKTPAIESDECLVRIYDSNLPFVADTSDLITLLDYPDTPICIVSVDSATNQNIIIWEKPITDQIRNYIVYKESDQLDVFDSIGVVPYDNQPFFLDVNSNPAVKSYRYKLGFDDSEGYVYPMGDMHQTIHLTISQGIGNTWNLTWGAYLGFEVATYNIYRSTNGASYELIETISSSFYSYTDINAPAGEIYYYIEVVKENGCNISTRDYEVSSAISNIVTNNFLNVEASDEPLISNIYPNPSNQLINVMTGSETGDLELQLLDMAGRIILTDEYNQVGSNFRAQLNVAELNDGVYFLRVTVGKVSEIRKVMIRH